jgi:hypothetical protein
MNATRNRMKTKRYPKRFESEIRFESYLKYLLKEMRISCMK